MVLSPCTEAFDREGKFENYTQLGLLKEYVLIAQAEQRVECRRRNVEGEWKTTVYGAGDCVALSSLGLEFAIAMLYRGLDD